MADEPDDVNYHVLPDQTAYKVRVDDTQDFRSYDMDARFPLFTNEFKVTMLEGDPGEGIGWHTHTPNLDQVILGLQGQLELTVRHEDGHDQVVTIGADEIGYIPAGATHKLAVVGEERFRSYVLYQNENVARLSSLDPDWEGYKEYDIGDKDGEESRPIGLWVDRRLDTVVKKDDDAVSP